MKAGNHYPARWCMLFVYAAISMKAHVETSLWPVQWCNKPGRAQELSCHETSWSSCVRRRAHMQYSCNKATKSNTPLMATLNGSVWIGMDIVESRSLWGVRWRVNRTDELGENNTDLTYLLLGMLIFMLTMLTTGKDSHHGPVGGTFVRIITSRSLGLAIG